MFISVIKAYRLENISKRLSLLCLVVLVLVCVDQFCRVLEVSLGACLHAYECVSLSVCVSLCVSLSLPSSVFVCLSVCFSVTVSLSVTVCPPPPSLSHCLSICPRSLCAPAPECVCMCCYRLYIFAIIVCHPFAVELTTSRRCLDLLVFSSFLSLCRLPVQELTRPMAIAEHGKPCSPGPVCTTR